MTDRQSYRRRLLALGALLPLAIAAAGAALILSWLPTLPGEVAVHWTSSGADGFAPPLTLAGVLLLSAVLFGAIVVTALWNASGGRGGNGRILLAVSAGLPTFLAVAFAGILTPQSGGGDPRTIEFPVAALVAGIGCAAAVGALAWMLAPTAPPRDRMPEPVENLQLARDARVVWIGTASAPRPLLLVIGGVAAVLLLVGAALTFTIGAPGLVLLAASAILVVACLTLSWRVRIDDDGLVARPLIGIPVVRVSLGQVKEASVIDVSPVDDFGGWGLRYSSSGTGVILRTGTALRLDQTGGAFTITLDDAPRAAGLVNALIARRSTAESSR